MFSDSKIAYDLQLALTSIRKTPVLSALMVAAIGIGIGACMTIITIFYLMSANPSPEKSSALCAITLDSWGASRPFDTDRPERAPHQLTFQTLGTSRL